MTPWNEILTNTGSYWLLGRGGQCITMGESGVRVILYGQPTRPPDMDPDIYYFNQINIEGPFEQPEFQFVESNGGQLHLREKVPQKWLSYDSSRSRFVATDSPLTAFVPDEAGGNVVLRFELNQETRYLGATGSLYPSEMTASDDPTNLSTTQWALVEKTAPDQDTLLERWLHTYAPQNRFSPGAFLEHVRLVVIGDDLIHTAAEGYLDDLTDALKQSILTKIDHWKNDFAAATALQRAEGHGAMLLASSYFYKAPESEYNELDPDRPPDWSDLDDELGGDPYPG